MTAAERLHPTLQGYFDIVDGLMTVLNMNSACSPFQNVRTTQTSMCDKFVDWKKKAYENSIFPQFQAFHKLLSSERASNMQSLIYYCLISKFEYMLKKKNEKKKQTEWSSFYQYSFGVWWSVNELDALKANNAWQGKLFNAAWILLSSLSRFCTSMGLAMAGFGLFWVLSGPWNWMWICIFGS